jgi:hypothetical protein
MFHIIFYMQKDTCNVGFFCFNIRPLLNSTIWGHAPRLRPIPSRFQAKLRYSLPTICTGTHKIWFMIIIITNKRPQH